MTLTRKIHRLYQLLVQEKGDFENMAGQVNDNSLRLTILCLAQQNNQYAAELLSYMQSARTPLTQKDQITGKTRAVFSDENGALTFCNNNEKKLVTAYRKILKESVVYEGLQKMLNNQLNGVLSASMQLKLLRSLTPGLHTRTYAV